MSDPGDPFGSRKPHAPNYASLNVEHSLEDAPPPRQAEAPAPYLSDLDKAEAAEAMRNAEMVRFNRDRDPSPNERKDYARKLDKLDYDQLKELEEAKRLAAEKMQQRTPPDAPDEPTRPDSYPKSR